MKEADKYEFDHRGAHFRIERKGQWRLAAVRGKHSDRSNPCEPWREADNRAHCTRQARRQLPPRRADASRLLGLARAGSWPVRWSGRDFPLGVDPEAHARRSIPRGSAVS